MPKRILKVKNASIRAWDATNQPGIFVMYAFMAEYDELRGWPEGIDIRTSTIVSVNGVPIGEMKDNQEGELHAGDLVETLNTIYEVV